MVHDADSSEAYYVSRVSSALGIVVALGLCVALVMWHREIIGFITESLWGAPAWVAWVGIVVALSGMVVLSTERTLFIARPGTRTATFRRFVLWVVPVSERTVRFEEIRHIDLHHTGEHSVAGMPRLSEWLSPEHFSWGRRAVLNGLSAPAWLADWILCAVPYLGVAEIRVFLHDRTEWTIMRAGSEAHVAAIGTELKRITGARLT